MDNRVLLSLCIPTNGVIEWVFPVLDSIYADNPDLTRFQTVVADNGNNDAFAEKMREYCGKFFNLKYVKTQAFEFLNEIECYKNADGEFIKFINHRTILLKGALDKFIKFAEENVQNKPCVYFSNGVLKNINGEARYKTFNDYVKKLSYLTSWSTGMAFWKSDFDKIKKYDDFNVLFPHTNVLFSERKKDEYVIENTYLLEEIPVGKIPKGRYNLFNAFAVEFPSVIEKLFRSGDIDKETFLSIKKDNYKFVQGLYFDYIFRKKPCSYDLSGVKESLNAYYSYRKTQISVPIVAAKRLYGKIKRLIKRSK